jgi:MFS family permease
MSGSHLALPGCPDPRRYPLWLPILITVLAGAGFTVFKFVVISEIALNRADAEASLPFAWMRAFIDTRPDIPLAEAVSQGLAATFTVGILAGFTFNAPLAGAWRVGPMFVLSAVGMGLAALIAIPGGLNPWYAALLMGLSYGTACAARGKSVPLLAAGNGRDDTTVSGLINAGLVVGLLLGTILGSQLAVAFISEPATADTPAREVGRVLDAPWLAHAILAVGLGLTALLSLRLRLPEQPAVPFMHGLRDIVGVTVGMLRCHWPLLIGGGIAWGICASASLAVMIYGIQDLKISQVTVSYLGGFVALGAIGGNLVSGWFRSRAWVAIFFAALAVLIATFPYVVHTWWQGAIAMTLLGFLYMVPTNVIDARFLALAGREGKAGYGGTVFSMVHNVFILLVGTGLTILLFSGVVDSRTQFLILAGFTVVALVVSVRAPVRD